MADDNTNNLRASMLREDLDEDRRQIMKKIQQRRRTQSKKKLAEQHKDGGKDSPAEYYGNSETSGYTQNTSYDVVDQDAGFEESYSIDEDLFHEVQAAHQEDEERIGGRIEDGQEDGLEAMNQALTSPPVAWWAMRKQWQKRRGGMLNFAGLGASSARAPSEGGEMGDEEEMDGPDASYRSGASGRPRLGGSTVTEAGVVGHPVMLEDPMSIGYDLSAFRQNPYASVDKRKRNPTVLYVSRDVLQKRKMQQSMYIIAALCVVFLFIFLLEQRKLSHYAMVESPMSLSAYLAGEELMTKNDGNSQVTLGDLGLEEFDNIGGVPEVEFGNIEVNPNDPLAIPELANDPLVGNNHYKPLALDDFSQIHGTDRFQLLKQVVVGWGVTPTEIFENKGSAQYKALYWMAHDDVLRYTPDNDHWIKKIIQRYALTTIYYATNGPGWTNAFFFLSSKDECNWNHKSFTGFFAGAGHCEGGYITALALWSNNLDGGEFGCAPFFDDTRLHLLLDVAIF